MIVSSSSEYEKSNTCQASWPNGKALLSGTRGVAEIAGSNPVGVALVFIFIFIFIFYFAFFIYFCLF